MVENRGVEMAILWRVAVVQVLAVAMLSTALGLVLPHSFFEDWGWFVGPLAWMACGWFTARVVGLPVGPVLRRAAIAGLPSLLFVLVGLHWLGAVVAVAIFALWCAALPGRDGRMAT